jgi:hypothetical protein
MEGEPQDAVCEGAAPVARCGMGYHALWLVDDKDIGIAIKDCKRNRLGRDFFRRGFGPFESEVVAILDFMGELDFFAVAEKAGIAGFELGAAHQGKGFGEVFVGAHRRGE